MPLEVAEKCWRAGLANIFLFQSVGRRLEIGINAFEKTAVQKGLLL